jgi:hypothetical protein
MEVTITVKGTAPDNIDMDQVKMDVHLALSGAIKVKSVEVEKE